MIAARCKIVVEVITELCQQVLNGKGIPDEWKTSVVIPIYKEKKGVMNYESCRGIKLLEHALKIVEKILKKDYET